jgi:hypothetical protein
MRYIDADSLIERIACLSGIFTDEESMLNRLAVLIAIDDAETADVVPKSEVADLKIELKAMRNAANSYKMHYKDAMKTITEVRRLATEIKADLPFHNAKIKAEVAREIFAEIEKILSDNWHTDCQMGDCIEDYYDDDIRDDIADLKKKYTEGEK